MSLIGVADDIFGEALAVFSEFTQRDHLIDLVLQSHILDFALNTTMNVVTISRNDSME